jgi:uncharacterized Ntn-hydrolase superfamily protein
MSRRIVVGAGFRLLLMLLAGADCAQATYSIVACDAKTRECGVAVETNNLAVGASVPYAQAGVGAVASQFETNPHYGPRGLALLAQGMSPAEAMKKILAEDGNFDGQGIAARQVGIVSVDGRTASYTGEEAAGAEWAGARSGAGYGIQGNGLAGPRVVEEMERAFLGGEGSLAERLIAALVAGDLAGGQRTGRESAALLVKTPDGWPMDIDLRVDHSSDPVRELRTLFDMQSARQEVIDANTAARKGEFARARTLLIAAVAQASGWPRVWIRAARVAESIEEPTLALQYIYVAFTQNPAWADAEIGEGNFAQLGASAEFHHWVSAAKEKNAVAAFERLRDTEEATPENRITVSRMLLETGRASDALLVLKEIPPRVDESIELRLLRSAAYSANGDNANAIEQCDVALNKEPNNVRVQYRMAQLKGKTRP